jgi:hypothetical protein
MNLGRLLLIWTARHMLALILIILILVAARFAAPPVSAWLQEQVRIARTAPAQRAALTRALDDYQRYAAGRRAEAEKALEGLRNAPETLLRRRRAAIDAAIAVQGKATLTNAQLALAGVRGDSQSIFSHYRGQAEIGLLRREMRTIDALLVARLADRDRATLAERRLRAVQQLAASRAEWEAAREQARRLNRRPLAPARNYVCRNAPLGVGCENYRALTRANARMEAAAARHVRARQEISIIDRAARSLAVADRSVAQASSILDQQSAELRAELRRVDEATQGNWLVWIGRPMLEVLPTALGILAAAILGPPLIKAILYFAVAPLAAGRPPLRLLGHDGGRVGYSGAGSAPSQVMDLEPGHELLLMPEAIQSTPNRAEKSTKWLLSWSMPLSSLASGMVALVRIRVQSPEAVVLSATGSGFAEVALISITEGSAMVLRPRALRGLLQPIKKPVSISRHWRLRHLSAWLTFQFRYLVFHGPCTLVVEGTRGVRLEPAEAGRAINQAATLGFSAGLAYSVSRSEAFGAYLLGKQDLFNDSFMDGPGCYLYEEVPRAGTRGSLWGRGLRGLGDAALKIFGL